MGTQKCTISGFVVLCFENLVRASYCLINLAKDMYRDEYSIGFQFEHCWKLLKNLPKWKQLKPVVPRKKSISPSLQPVIHLGVDNDDEDVIVDLERPIGKKAAKEREKKRKSKDCGDKEIMMEVLAELTEVKKRSYEERMKNIDTAKEEIVRIEKQKLEIELRKEAREQKKEEREIMMMDTSYLSSIQLEYIQSLQMEIMQKRRTT
ncbi:uncharacterized protein LOC133863196 [Alnus glutinosa]|uniref:uncharacterized protein LOC133863196 n=1 Tax=Alnus glutinosa TaxID=3517 RepID=UPI002D7675B1|nr:uncharacterized protein LOC133863196 [Alnus glutinosa]